MSHSKLLKYIERPLELRCTLTKQPILIADSKGNYLKQHSDLISSFGYNVDFVCRGGARFSDYYAWLENNLYRKVHQYTNIVLYIWLGTCDLTQKHGKFIKLRHLRDDIAVNCIKQQIDKYIAFVSHFPSVKIVFLEIPPYSIQEWNKSRGHLNPQECIQQDLILYERISILNEYIRCINSTAGVSSPRYKLDLLRYRKPKGETNQRVSLNFRFYRDGIHPDYYLARCWMKRLVARVFCDCL